MIKNIKVYIHFTSLHTKIVITLIALFSNA